MQCKYAMPICNEHMQWTYAMKINDRLSISQCRLHKVHHCQLCISSNSSTGGAGPSMMPWQPWNSNSRKISKGPIFSHFLNHFLSLFIIQNMASLPSSPYFKRYSSATERHRANAHRNLWVVRIRIPFPKNLSGWNHPSDDFMICQLDAPLP